MSLTHAARASVFDGWRAHARALLAAGAPPESVTWIDAAGGGGADLFEQAAPPAAAPGARPLRLPAATIDRLREVACHVDPDRWALMYRFVWRRAAEMRALERDAADADVVRLDRMASAVRREVHRMHAFVRFRPVDEPRTRWVAWFEPEHHVLERAAPFFVERFTSLDWTLVTPGGALRWNGEALVVEREPPARPAGDVPDPGETLWRAYYRSVFDRARINPSKLAREMPVRYRANMPEAAEIAPLLAEAPRELARTLASRAAGWAGADGAHAVAASGDGVDADAGAAPSDDAASGLDGPSPDAGGDPWQHEPLQRCRRCPLWRDASRAVAGEGPADAPLMLVGEQPGDAEDLAGRPFVGPAGRELDVLLGEAGIDRGRTYLTNAVKHFKWEPRGTRRLHKTAAQREADACATWLEHEIGAVAPDAIVALGATAVRALLGPQATVEAARRGNPHRRGDAWVIATWHPAALLRARDPAAVESMRAQMIDDLTRARAHVQASSAG